MTTMTFRFREVDIVIDDFVTGYHDIETGKFKLEANKDV